MNVWMGRGAGRGHGGKSEAKGGWRRREGEAKGWRRREGKAKGWWGYVMNGRMNGRMNDRMNERYRTSIFEYSSGMVL